MGRGQKKSGTYYSRALAVNPAIREVFNARSKAWRTKKLLSDPTFLLRENIKKRAAEKLRNGGTCDPKGKKRLKPSLVIRARKRGREAGLEATIKHTDLVWPEFCPVLGLKLNYDTPRGQRKFNDPTLPSLDRIDNSKGYVPGNVFVISLRANQLKGNATADELEAIARYARHGCGALAK